MREIKFRAWDKIGKMFIMVSWGFDIDNQGNIYPAETKPKTDLVLMQYTGWKDKNGKEIFEGDKYSWRNKVGNIEYRRGAFYCIDQDQSEWLLSAMVDKEFEIIGNIYENENLLEAK